MPNGFNRFTTQFAPGPHEAVNRPVTNHALARLTARSNAEWANVTPFNGSVVCEDGEIRYFEFSSSHLNAGVYRHQYPTVNPPTTPPQTGVSGNVAFYGITVLLAASAIFYLKKKNEIKE
jgi:LPXTG-motif cell wall-anchored protein